MDTETQAAITTLDGKVTTLDDKVTTLSEDITALSDTVTVLSDTVSAGFARMDRYFELQQQQYRRDPARVARIAQSRRTDG